MTTTSSRGVHDRNLVHRARRRTRGNPWPGYDQGCDPERDPTRCGGSRSDAGKTMSVAARLADARRPRGRPGTGTGAKRTHSGTRMESTDAGWTRANWEGQQMPWFPDFLGAAELARRQGRAAGQAHLVGRYLAALNSGRTQPLEDVLAYRGGRLRPPGGGTVRGHRQLRQFVKRSKSLLAERHARTETIAATVVGNRVVVVELLAHLAYEGREVEWPVAVVADSLEDRSVVFRTYLSERVIDGRQHLRAPILPVDDVPLADIVNHLPGGARPRRHRQRSEHLRPGRISS